MAMLANIATGSMWARPRSWRRCWRRWLMRRTSQP